MDPLSTLAITFNTNSVLGLVHLVLFIIGLIGVLQSGLDPVKKLIWVLVILLLPLIGLILWFLIGKKA